MKKILIIEDDSAYMHLLKDALSPRYTISTAPDGLQGLALARSEKPDLILLDISMPVMNGMTMLQKLRENDYGKSRKVIVLTNLQAEDNILQQVVETQPAYYFIKSDVKLEDLVEKIKELLDENSQSPLVN